MLRESNPEKYAKLLELQSQYDEVKKSADQFKSEAEGVHKFIPR